MKGLRVILIIIALLFCICCFTLVQVVKPSPASFSEQRTTKPPELRALPRPRPVFSSSPFFFLDYGDVNITLNSSIIRGLPVRIKRFPNIALSQCPLASLELAGSVRKGILLRQRDATPHLPTPPELRLLRVTGDGHYGEEVNKTDKVCDYGNWNSNLYRGYGRLVPPAMIARSPLMYAVPRDLLPHFTVAIGVLTIDNVHSANEDVRAGPVGPTGWVRRQLIRRTWAAYDAVWSSALLGRYMREKQHGAVTQELYKDKHVLVRFIVSRNHHLHAHKASKQLLPYDYSPALLAEASLHRDVLFFEANEGRSIRKHSNGAHGWGMEAELGMSRKSLWWYALAFHLYSYDYLMKADDDTYIRIPHYVHTLQTIVAPMIFPRGSSQRCEAKHTTYRGVLYGKTGWYHGEWCGLKKYDCLFLAGMAITMSRDVGALLLDDTELYELSGVPFNGSYQRAYKNRQLDHEDVMVGTALSRFAMTNASQWWWEKCPATKTSQATYDNSQHSPAGAMMKGLGILPLHDCRYIELDVSGWDNHSMVLHHVKLPMYTEFHNSFAADSKRTPQLPVSVLGEKYLRVGCSLRHSYDHM